MRDCDPSFTRVIMWSKCVVHQSCVGTSVVATVIWMQVFLILRGPRTLLQYERFFEMRKHQKHASLILTASNSAPPLQRPTLCLQPVALAPLHRWAREPSSTKSATAWGLPASAPDGKHVHVDRNEDREGRGGRELCGYIVCWRWCPDLRSDMHTGESEGHCHMTNFFIWYTANTSLGSHHAEWWSRPTQESPYRSCRVHYV